MAKTFTAVSILIGTTIGAGILGLPYVIMRSGFLIGFLNLILIAVIILIITLYLGEIGLRTKNNRQLTGYAELYLGKKGKFLMLLAFAFGIYSSLIAYLIGEGESLSFLIFNTGQYSLHLGIAFWLLLSITSCFGMKALKEGEKFGTAIIFILIILITILFWNKIDISNLTYNNPSLFYLPFGVTLFAFLGFAAIPEVEEILTKDKHLTKKTIYISTLTTLLIYTIFTAVVLGSQGTSTPNIATIALGKIFIILGILTMYTSYLALTTALVNSLHYDFKKSKTKAWLYTISLPLIIYIILNIFNASSFTKVIGIGGVISGSLTGILILLMIKKAKLNGKREPEYSIPHSNLLTWLIILILTIGTVLELVNSV
ncbi:MAG: aromatic amino acid transport family protein [archaeon]